MRHKILLGLHGMLEEAGACLGGVSELDETFVLDSYKGSPLPPGLGRPARRHGAKAQRWGISKEYVYICTGVERKGSAMAGIINRAKPSSRELEEVFKGHIKERDISAMRRTEKLSYPGKEGRMQCQGCN